MQAPHAPNRQAHRVWMLLCLLAWLTGCSNPYRDNAGDPPFGQSVRRALQTQEQVPSGSRQATGVPFNELEPALERQQKAKPPETPQNRSGGLTGSSYMGP